MTINIGKANNSNFDTFLDSNGDGQESIGDMDSDAN